MPDYLPILLITPVKAEQKPVIAEYFGIWATQSEWDRKFRILSVLQTSSTEIIASLPQGTPASTYLLKVSSADDLSRSETFNLQVDEVEAR